MKKRVPFIIAAVFVTLYIFHNSMQCAEVSSTRSTGILNQILMFFNKFGIDLGNRLTNHVIRKCAHMFEFFAQGVLISLSFKTPFTKRIVYILFLGLLTACTDEYIQLFFDGRAGMITDVFIDFFGTISAVFIIGVLYRLRRR